ncbi:MAG: sorbosone dehydrogenase family protein [Bacteriovoracia bacterium]
MRPLPTVNSWAIPLTLFTATVATVAAGAADILPKISGTERGKPPIRVRLAEVASGFSEPTDIQFLPTDTNIMIVLEKGGRMRWVSLLDKSQGEFLKLAVRTSSEMGLLGLAFHPKFETNRAFYVHYNPENTPKPITRISEFTIRKSLTLKDANAINERMVLEIEQPYSNHKGGQLAFGPDGYLYIGMGDGGSAGDPQGNGQNPKSLLGKFLRIDINGKDKGKHYSVPRDNPFLADHKYAPEIWATGLRNPWRFTFEEGTGSIIAADVGQNAWEEISRVEKGKNYGWNAMEGTHCFPESARCTPSRFEGPVWEYGRDDGASITGGYFYSAQEISELNGLYVFGDFVSGRLWAAKLAPRGLGPKDTAVHSLGTAGFGISTFGRDSAGRVYVADFGGGRIFRITKP